SRRGYKMPCSIKRLLAITLLLCIFALSERFSVRRASVWNVSMADQFRVFVGWDQREPEAYEVAKFSLTRRASISVEVTPIKLEDLRKRGLYRRDIDPLASTEFTYSRFLTPALAGFRGWALFCDCDFLWLGDIAGLAEYMRVPKALYCVQHDYQ